MSRLSSILSAFDPITLAEMDNVKLMERVDSKYVFPTSQLNGILKGMQNDYCILDINGVRHHRYESLYFDTDDFRLYKKHQRGMLNRWKIRFRRYVDSGGLTFFEIKFKNNKERTIKSRVKMDEIKNMITGEAESFLKEISSFDARIFSPKIWVNYSRMTFVNKFSQERLTIDTDLKFIQAGSEGTTEISFPHMAIAEAKRDKAASVSQFIRLVRLTGVREGSISKYCFGVYNLFDLVKKNNFKPKVRFIKKMSTVTEK